MNCSGPGGLAYKVKLCPILGSLKPSRIPIPITHLKIPRMHKIFKQSLESPVGLVTIETCHAGVHKIRIGETSENETPDEQSDLKELELNQSGVAHQTLTWLQNYFQHQPDGSDLFKKPSKYPPICWEGIEKTEFTDYVLKTLMENVKYGDTVAYADLAKSIGKPGASRAVGNALKENPILIIIPCHRIIRSDGTIGNYAGGRTAKKWLIEFEKENK